MNKSYTAHKRQNHISTLLYMTQANGITIGITKKSEIAYRLWLTGM